MKYYPILIMLSLMCPGKKTNKKKTSTNQLNTLKIERSEHSLNLPKYTENNNSRKTGSNLNNFR